MPKATHGTVVAGDAKTLRRTPTHIDGIVVIEDVTHTLSEAANKTSACMGETPREGTTMALFRCWVMSHSLQAVSGVKVDKGDTVSNISAGL